MIDITKLPLSVTSFSDFVAKSRIYVDKTDLIKIACEATNDNLKPVLYSAATYLQLFLKHNTDNQYVLLIDEYDAPLTAAMADKEEFEKRRSVLSEFFLTVKSYSSKFRFIFITGVTRYSNTSIFSAFNNIKDISFNPTYGAIVGYTQEELEHYFGDYIKNAAVALSQLPPPKEAGAWGRKA